MAEKTNEINIDDVVEDMCFSEIGWVRDAAEDYFHRVYLHERKVDNHDRKWWQFWKPKFLWEKV